MILQLTEDTTSIGIRLKAVPIQQYLADWQGIALGILPGQRQCSCEQQCCAPGGSPWYVWGCWPGHRTGVDLMNPPPPDFPAFFIQASEVNDNNLIIFNLPERWRQQVPFGRYTGFIRYQPDKVFYDPINARVNLGLAAMPQDPGCYHTPPEPCACHWHAHSPKPCILAEFDVDYGPRCSQHIIDRIDVELEHE